MIGLMNTLLLLKTLAWNVSQKERLNLHKNIEMDFSLNSINTISQMSSQKSSSASEKIQSRHTRPGLQIFKFYVILPGKKVFWKFIWSSSTVYSWTSVKTIHTPGFRLLAKEKYDMQVDLSLLNWNITYENKLETFCLQSERKMN